MTILHFVDQQWKPTIGPGADLEPEVALACTHFKMIKHMSLRRPTCRYHIPPSQNLDMGPSTKNSKLNQIPQTVWKSLVLEPSLVRLLKYKINIQYPVYIEGGYNKLCCNVWERLRKLIFPASPISTPTRDREERKICICTNASVKWYY